MESSLWTKGRLRTRSGPARLGDEAVRGNPQGRCESIVEAVAELDEDFARFKVVSAAESEAIVEQHAAVGNVEGLKIDGKALAKFLAKRKIKGGVRLEMIARSHRRPVAIGEAGGVRDVGGSIRVPRESEFAAQGQRVTLGGVEEPATAAEGKIGEAAVDTATAESELIRVSEINLAAVMKAG